MSTFDPSAPASPDSGLFGLPTSLDKAGVVIVPVAWDATASFHTGTAMAPAAVLAASHQVNLYDVDVGRPWDRDQSTPDDCRPYKAGIALAPALPEIARWNREAEDAARPVHDAGGGARGAFADRLARVNALSVKVDEAVEKEVDRWAAAGKLVGVLGGDHSVALGSIVAAARRSPELAVLQIDAHCDLRRAYEGFERSHASVMRNALERCPDIRLVQVGIRDLCDEEADFVASAAGRVFTFFDSELKERLVQGEPWSRLCDFLVENLPPDVYVSIDIDGLDPSLCPGTGTPVPGGLSYFEVIHLLADVVRSGRHIVGFDLVEVGGGEWDATVGARLLYKLIGWTLRSRRRPEW